jgi:hypothetical protein
VASTTPFRLKPTGFPKRALLAFVIALAAYAGLYYAIEHRRATKGPWQVTFTREQTDTPAILINQPAIGITNVQISFAGATHTLTNGSVKLVFNEARRTPFDVPLGKCVFLDTVFLPGTIVFEIAGHQIQLMPRVLTIDGAERPWNSGEAVSLTNKPAAAKSQ